MKKIFVFAGQGSQFYGMGKELYKSNNIFKRIVDEIDEKIISIAGRSIKLVMFDDRRKRSEMFDDLKESSLAIFLFELASAKMLIELGIIPDAVSGCSLGEVVAAVVAGILDIDDAIELLCRQSELFERILPQGAMIAVYDDFNRVDKLGIVKKCELASYNHSRHFVITGIKKDVMDAEQKLREHNISYMVLPVHYAFHSSHIEGARETYLDLFNQVILNKSKCEMYSCVSGKKIEKIEINYMWNVLRWPIKWRECVNEISSDSTMFIDLSADGELASMLRYQLDTCDNIFKISSTFGSQVDIYQIIKKIKEREDRNLKAFVFPGQGSQVKGMGEKLFDEFSELVSKADKILGYSIKELCLKDPDRLLSRTDYTQPALYVVCVLEFLKRMKDSEKKPDYVAGHSVGEYAALFAAGIVDFETGLKLVKRRGELMVRAKGGKMAAVIGLKEKQVRQVLRDNGFTEIDIANLNALTQIVISGLDEDIKAVEKVFLNTEGCIMFKILNVSGAFHSRYMECAKKEFTEYMKTFRFNKGMIPIIANITARPYKEDEIIDTLSKQLVSSVYWTDSVRYMIAKGVKEFEEIGPGYVLQGLNKKIVRESEPLILETESNKLPKEEKKEISKEDFILGSKEFISDYNLKYAYIMGAMYYGISGEKMVIESAKNGILCSFGTQGLQLKRVEDAIKNIQEALTEKQPYSFNLVYNLSKQNEEKDIINLYLKYGVHVIEISDYFTITKSLVKYRLKGLKRGADGSVFETNHIIAKLSRPEIAEEFMHPAPKRIIDSLLRDGEITNEEAIIAQDIPMSYDICVEADSGGHTDCANPFSVLPAICYMRNHIVNQYGYKKKIRVGAAGGIGTPVSAAAAFIMQADFVMTGSINQCTIEASVSDIAKEMMSNINVQDTCYVEEFKEHNYKGKIQVLKKGTLFPVRANKLCTIYKKLEDINMLDEKSKKQIEERYFRKSFDDIWNEIKLQYEDRPEVIENGLENPKKKMEMIFNWYYSESSQWAIKGISEYQTDFQIMCGPALGAFNQWVKGTELEEWRNRSVGKIGEILMEETTKYIVKIMKQITK